MSGNGFWPNFDLHRKSNLFTYHYPRDIEIRHFGKAKKRFVFQVTQPCLVLLRTETPLIVHPTLSVHVNNKRCDCNGYCSRLTVDNKLCDCNT